MSIEVHVTPGLALTKYEYILQYCYYYVPPLRVRLPSTLLLHPLLPVGIGNKEEENALADRLIFSLRQLLIKSCQIPAYIPSAYV